MYRSSFSYTIFASTYAVFHLWTCHWRNFVCEVVWSRFKVQEFYVTQIFLGLRKCIVLKKTVLGKELEIQSTSLMLIPQLKCWKILKAESALVEIAIVEDPLYRLRCLQRSEWKLWFDTKNYTHTGTHSINILGQQDLSFSLASLCEKNTKLV